MSIQVPPDSTGKTVETFVPTGGTDHRQSAVIADDTVLAARAKVQNADPGSTDYGLTIRNVRGNGSLPVRIDPVGTTVQPVSGTVTGNQGSAAAVTAGWPVVSGALAETTAAWTSATAQNTALQLNVAGYGLITVTLNQGSTLTGGVVTFEVSDTTAFTNAYPIQAVQPNSFATGTTYTLQVSTNQSFQVDVSGFAAFRVRLSTVITGTATVNVGIAASAIGVAPLATVGGVVTANIQANASVNLNQVAGASVATAAAGIVKVGLTDGSGNVLNSTSNALNVSVQNATLSVTESGTWNVGSSTATGAAVPANAFYKGGLAKTALPAAATDGNLTGVMLDKFGRQIVLLASIRDLTGTQTTTLSASTAETTIVTAGAAGVFNDLVMLIISNTSASTNTRIDFRDTTGGTVLFSLESIGGGAPVGFALPIPIPQTTAATNWTAQCATSTTDIRIYAVFVKNK